LRVDDRLRNIGRILRGDIERAEDDILALEVDGFEVAAGLDENGVAGGGGVDARLDGGGVAGHADDAGGRAGGSEKDAQANDERDDLFHGFASRKGKSTCHLCMNICNKADMRKQKNFIRTYIYYYSLNALQRN